MTKTDLKWMTERPIAHRGLHDPAHGPLENSLGAFQAAIDNGFSIECDLQFSSDKVPMVYHDNILDRLTTEKGDIRKRSARELSGIRLGDTRDTIPTLEDMLDLVDGKSGLVIELKGEEGRDDGFVKAVLEALSGYSGPCAIMSFDHWLLDDARHLQCNVPLGLIAEGDGSHNPAHKSVADRNDVDFISYNIMDLPNVFVSEFRAKGKPVICWTVRNIKTLQKADEYCDQITFEGIDPVLAEKS